MAIDIGNGTIDGGGNTSSRPDWQGQTGTAGFRSWDEYQEWLESTTNSTKTCNLIVNYYANGYNGEAAVNPPPSSARSYTGQSVNVSLSVLVSTGDSMSNEGYVFIGWATSNDTQIVSYNPGDRISYSWSANMRGNHIVDLYAVWTNQNVISYHSDENSNESSTIYQVKETGQSATLYSETFTRRGYTQTGWATEAGGAKVYDFGDSYSSSEPLDLYPVWQANTYTITYMANGGTGTMTTQTVTFGSTFTPSNCAFTRNGYSFASWNENSDGKGLRWQVKQYTLDRAEDMTFYAIWKGNEYYVTYSDGSSNISEEYSGDIVTLNAENETLVVELKADIEPIQDFNGYDKPWAAGAGDNLVPEDQDWRYIYPGISSAFSNGIWTVTNSHTTNRQGNLSMILPAGTYYWHIGYPSDGATSWWINDEDTNERISLIIPQPGGATTEFTLSNETSLKICHYFNVGDTTFSDFMISAAPYTEYSPYANVCPITGRTWLTAYRTGKNFLAYEDKAEVEEYGIKYSISDGVFHLHGTSTAGCNFNTHTIRFPLPAGTYTFSLTGEYESTTYPYPIIQLRRWTGSPAVIEWINGARPSVTFTLDSYEDGLYVNFNIGEANVAADADVKLQIEPGSSATEWEPYRSQGPYVADWSEDAGTVYGGTVDFVSGALLSTMINIASYNGETIGEPWVSSLDEYSPGATPTTGAQVVYTIGTPDSYLLTPSMATLVPGINRFFSNSGAVHVKYWISNDDEIIMPYSIATYGEPFVTRRNKFERFGVTFKGWNTAPDGTGEDWILSDDSMDTYKRTSDGIWNLSQNVILYAQWDPYIYPYGRIFFGGKYSNDFGIVVEAPPSYEYAERAFTHKQVNGKNGDTLLDSGRYENVSKTYKIACYDPNKSFYETAVALSTFLHSASSDYIRIEDSYEPGCYRMAIYEEKNELENILAKAGKAEIKFNCKPQRFLISGDEEIVIASSGSTIYNPTEFNAKPLIRVQGTGNVTINGRTVSIGANDNDILVDCESQNATDLGGVSMDYYIYCDEFPILSPGFNTITYDETIESVKITPRWWII